MIDPNFAFVLSASAGIDEAYRIKGLLPDHWSNKVKVDELNIANHRISARADDDTFSFTAIQSLYNRPLAAHSAVNGAVNLARLGCNITLVSAVGDDIRGRMLKDQMKEKLVKCIFLHREITPYSFVLIDDFNRKVVLIRKDEYIVDEDEARRKCTRLPADRIILMGLHSSEIPLARIISGDEQRKFDYLIPSRNFYSQLQDPEIAAFCKDVDAFQVNGDEADEIFGTKMSREEQLSAICGLGPRTALITLGNHGLVANNGAEVIQLPVEPARREADPTGCGDTLGSTFCLANVMFPFMDSIKVAMWSAARCAEQLGANGNTPRWQEFYNYLHRLQYQQQVKLQPAEVLP